MQRLSREIGRGGTLPPAVFEGILTAMVTPFDKDGEVDEDATVRLIHHLLENGSDGLVITGSTGEAATLTDDVPCEG